MAFPKTTQRINVEDMGDVTVVTFKDKRILDEVKIQKMGEELFDLPDEQGKKKVLLDFSNVEYFSSAALGKLITLNKKLRGQGRGQLRLCSMHPEIYEVLEITRLNKVFPVDRDQDDALELFK